MTNIGTAPLPREPYAGLPELPEFTLTSTDVQDGGTAPEWMRSALFGVAGGQDRSPQLSWSGFPEGTKSFVLTDLLRPGCAGPQRLLALDYLQHSRQRDQH